MPHSITIAAAASGLNQFVNKNSDKISSTLRQGLEFEKDLSFVECEYSYTGHDIVVSDILQPYQYQFTPNNTESHDGITATLQPIKVDALFTAEQLEKFANKWKSNYWDPDPKKIKVKYADYIIDKVIMPKVLEEMNLASWAGEYVAPTPGTAGAVLTSVDGFRKKIADHITDGKLTPLVTGALVAGTMYDQVQTFCKAIPEPYRYKKGLIFMSKTRAQQYSDAYETKFLSNAAVIDSVDGLRLKVPSFNKTIVGVTAMEGSDRIICQFDNMDGMQVGSRKGFAKYFKLRFQEFERQLKVLSEAWRFYDFETTLHSFVNEQV